MKNILRTLFMLLVILIPTFVFSQVEGLGFDLKGIDISKKYTKQQVVDAWGEPDTYYHNVSDLGITESYYYNQNGMIFSDGYLTTISLSDNKFSIFSSKNGGLKVGDPVSRISGLGIGTLIKKDENNYDIRVQGIDDQISIRAESGIIKLILYIESF